MEHMRKLALLLFLLVIPFSCVPQTRAQGLAWDPRLDSLGVTLEAAVECSGGCWKLISAQYLDEQESQGLHHLFVKLLDEQGNQLGDRPWIVFYPGGSVRVLSKSAPDWADFALFDCYLPDRERGAYSAFAGDDIAKSDIVSGLGLPACIHNSYRFVWQWQPPSAPCVGCVPKAFLPLVLNP